MSVSEKWYKSTEAHLISCFSGGDSCVVEQARQSLLCSSVDHHPGYSSWVAIALPAHISTIQGNNLINNSDYTIIRDNTRF